MTLSTFITRAAGALAVSVLGTTAFAETSLRWSDGSPNRGDRAEHYEWIASELESRSEGSISVTFHWAGALLKPKAAAKGVGDGAADMATAIGAYTPKELAAYTVTDLPYAISDPWVSMRAAYELATTHPAMQQMFDDLNLHYVTNVTTTASQFLCKGEHISTVEDLKGKKIRSVGVYGRILSDLGAEVVRLGQGDVYQALDTGVVDCNQNYAYVIPVFKQQEVATKLTRMDWGQFLAFGLIMNKDTYAGMSDAEKAVLNEVASQSIDMYGERMITATEASFDGLAADGVDIKAMDPAEIAKLNAAAKSHIEGWVAKADEAGLPGQDIFDAYVQLLEKYEAIRKEQGYPWIRG